MLFSPFPDATDHIKERDMHLALSTPPRLCVDVMRYNSLRDWAGFGVHSSIK